MPLKHSMNISGRSTDQAAPMAHRPEPAKYRMNSGLAPMRSAKGPQPMELSPNRVYIQGRKGQHLGQIHAGYLS